MDHRSNPDEHDDDNARHIQRLEQSKAEWLQQIAQREAEHKSELSQRKADYERILAQIERRRKVDLQVLVTHVRKINGDLNAFLPISRLPPEILSHIFIAFSANYWASFRVEDLDTMDLLTCTYFSGFRDYPWQTLERVCKRWRDIVLQTPALFTWIMPDNRDMVNFEIQKSGILPLDIMEISAWDDACVMKCVLSALPRARSMAIRLSPKVLDAMPPRGLGSAHAPYLTTVDYKIELPPDYRRAIPTLSELDAPNLTVLKTTGGSLELLKTFIRPALTCLHMSKWSSENWPAIELLQLLGSLPALRVLSLCPDAIHADMSVLTIAEHITLPHLISLFLYDEDGSSGTVQLLDHITCPSLATLKYWPALAGQDVMHDALMAVQTKMRTTALGNTFLLRTIATLDPDSPADSREILLGLWDSAQPNARMLYPSYLGRGLLENETGSFISSRISSMDFAIETVLSMFTLSHVTNIYLEDRSRTTPLLVWRQLFRATPALHTLRAPLPGLVDILDVSKTDGQESPLLPMLRVLELGVSLYEKLDFCLLDTLVTFLQSRQKVVGSLHRLQCTTIWNSESEDVTPVLQSLIDAKIATLIEFDNREYVVDTLG